MPPQQKVATWRINRWFVIATTMAQQVLDNLEQWLVGAVPKQKQLRQREKHFNTVMASLCCLVLSVVPLYGGTVASSDSTSTVTFRSVGTWMHLGTQPFVFASFVHSFVSEKRVNNQSHVLGFLLSLFQSVQWGMANRGLGGLQLVLMSYVLLRMLVWLDTHGSIALSTVLIFATASHQLLLSVLTPVVFVWNCLLLALVVALESMSVAIPLNHTKTRHQVSMPIPLLYNSTTALVIYFTVVESLASLIPSAVLLSNRTVGVHSLVTLPLMFMTIWSLDRKLPKLQKTSAKTLVQQWKKQSYSLKGWRNEGAIRFVQRIIDNNLKWASFIVFSLWLCGSVLPPSFGITTLFVVVSTAKQFESEKWSLW